MYFRSLMPIRSGTFAGQNRLPFHLAIPPLLRDATSSSSLLILAERLQLLVDVVRSPWYRARSGSDHMPMGSGPMKNGGAPVTTRLATCT